MGLLHALRACKSPMNYKNFPVACGDRSQRSLCSVTRLLPPQKKRGENGERGCSSSDGSLAWHTRCKNRGSAPGSTSSEGEGNPLLPGSHRTTPYTRSPCHLTME